MKSYENLYFLKDNDKFVQKFLDDFLLFQIYSPCVIRYAYVKWPELSWDLRKNTPEKIQDLICRSPLLSTKELHKKLNEFQIKEAIDILRGYQACAMPLSSNPHVPQNVYNLLSKKGEQTLKILKKAEEEGVYTDKMADLALLSTHKFLGDEKYYLSYQMTKKMAQNLAIKTTKKEDNSVHYMFPTIQLTRGCQNNCSHCDSRAEGKMSHMPWPVFKGLYKKLNKYYKHYPQKEIDFYFSNFFADSDMLDYYDPISKTDAGDVGLWICEEKGYCQYLTRGVKNEGNALALAKALYSGHSICISFVDTPKENKEKSLNQLNQTLDIVESVLPQKTENNVLKLKMNIGINLPSLSEEDLKKAKVNVDVSPEISRPGNVSIVHLHLKSGPGVSPEIFRGYPVKETTIYALGRAKNFSKEEVEQHDDKDFLPKFIFAPDGSIDLQEVRNGEVEREKLSHLFKQQMGPHISPVRLFFRRHFKQN